MNSFSFVLFKHDPPSAPITQRQHEEEERDLLSAIPGSLASTGAQIGAGEGPERGKEGIGAARLTDHVVRLSLHFVNDPKRPLPNELALLVVVERG